MFMAPIICSVRYLCFGAFLVFAGSILMCVLGFVVVLPHEATREWQEVLCQVANVTYDSNQCACDQQESYVHSCLNKYPCLQIWVTYSRVISEPVTQQNLRFELTQQNSSTTNYGNDTTRVYPLIYQNGTQLRNITLEDLVTLSFDNTSYPFTTNDETNELFSTESFDVKATPTSILKGETYTQPTVISHRGMLYRYWTDAFYNKCTLMECAMEEWNIKETRRFQSEWGGKSQTFKCFSDPNDAGKLVLLRTPLSSMVHAIVWSTTCLVTGAVIWIGLCCGCWKIESENDKYTHSDYNKSGRGQLL